MSYTIAEFQQISANIQCLLDTNTLNILRFIEQNIVVTSETSEDTYSQTNRRSTASASGGGEARVVRNTNVVRSKRGSLGGGVKSSENWENIRSFKATKIETKSGIDKQMNEIRILLNKISTKNIDAQKPIIVESIIAIMQSIEDSDESHDQHKDRYIVIDTIFAIVAANKMLSDVYANLYADLTNDATFGFIFREKLFVLIDQYKKSVEHINYVDPNSDYDAFCRYNKINDSRKVTAQFIVHLMKYKVIHPNVVLTIIDEFQKLSLKYIDEENKTNEVEEITENVFILVSLSKTSVEITETDVWKTQIAPTNKQMAGLKTKEHPSLSSRVIFKYMDL